MTRLPGDRPILMIFALTLSVSAYATQPTGTRGEQERVPTGRLIVSGLSHAQSKGVLTGLDVLVRDKFAPLANRKVGVITNHTGVDREGRSLIELLHDAPNIELVAIFSPEHGLKGLLDERVADSEDPLTGLTVYSLYGETRRPSDAMLDGVDTLVFDIQDIGARFYTYIATMAYAMEEAAKHDIDFVVLDRPNPINGTRVFGPFNDREGLFTAYHRTPLVHGMTVGELAKMFNRERDINVDLTVIEMEGWRRDTWYDESSLNWINPSPNMRSMTQAVLYPAIGMIEAANVSVGRGTDTPFERFGAPYIEPRKLADALNALELAGVRFMPFFFTPTSSKFSGKRCGGVQVLLLDRNAFDPTRTGLAIARVLRTLYPDTFEVAKVNNLVINADIQRHVEETSADKDLSHLWRDELEEFNQRRAAYLLYE